MKGSLTGTNLQAPKLTKQATTATDACALVGILFASRGGFAHHLLTHFFRRPPATPPLTSKNSLGHRVFKPFIPHHSHQEIAKVFLTNFAFLHLFSLSHLRLKMESDPAIKLEDTSDYYDNNILDPTNNTLSPEASYDDVQYLTRADREEMIERFWVLIDTPEEAETFHYMLAVRVARGKALYEQQQAILRAQPQTPPPEEVFDGGVWGHDDKSAGQSLPVLDDISTDDRRVRMMTPP